MFNDFVGVNFVICPKTTKIEHHENNYAQCIRSFNNLNLSLRSSMSNDYCMRGMLTMLGILSMYHVYFRNPTFFKKHIDTSKVIIIVVAVIIFYAGVKIPFSLLIVCVVDAVIIFQVFL